MESVNKEHQEPVAAEPKNDLELLLKDRYEQFSATMESNELLMLEYLNRTDVSISYFRRWCHEANGLFKSLALLKRRIARAKLKSNLVTPES